MVFASLLTRTASTQRPHTEPHRSRRHAAYPKVVTHRSLPVILVPAVEPEGPRFRSASRSVAADSRIQRDLRYVEVRAVEECCPEAVDPKGLSSGWEEASSVDALAGAELLGGDVGAGAG